MIALGEARAVRSSSSLDLLRSGNGPTSASGCVAGWVVDRFGSTT
jgi:hypothetical protein